MIYEREFNSSSFKKKQFICPSTTYIITEPLQAYSAEPTLLIFNLQVWVKGWGGGSIAATPRITITIHPDRREKKWQNSPTKFF